jgi:hypothetical protein
MQRNAASVRGGLFGLAARGFLTMVARLCHKGVMLQSKAIAPS